MATAVIDARLRVPAFDFERLRLDEDTFGAVEGTADFELLPDRLRELVFPELAAFFDDETLAEALDLLLFLVPRLDFPLDGEPLFGVPLICADASDTKTGLGTTPAADSASAVLATSKEVAFIVHLLPIPPAAILQE